MGPPAISSDAARAAAAFLTIGFPGETVPPGVMRLIEAGVGGCILFKRNFPDAAKVAQLTGELRRLGGTGLRLSVDQEGGRVQRLGTPYTDVPSMRAIGATGDSRLAADAGLILGLEMRAAGFDVVFAPVMDVDTNPVNPVIADRSFGSSVAVVGQMGTALIRAMQQTGVAACAKHFPGHGDTSQDSHHHLPRLNHGMDRLERIELPPFKAAIDVGVAAIMSAHVIFTPLEAVYPATLAHAALGGILRNRFGFEGVIFSDDLEMKALAEHFTLEEQLLKGIDAGIDQFLICHTESLQFRAIEIIGSAIDRGQIPARRVTETLARLTALKGRCTERPIEETLTQVQERADHRAAAERLRAIKVSAKSADPTAFKG